MTETARARPVLLIVTVGLLSLAADAATTAWALAALRGGHRIAVPGGVVRLQLALNHGAAFGLGSGLEPLIAIVSAGGVILFGLWARYASSGLERYGAALAAGGAAGNLPDRLIRPPGVLHGAVTDWIHRLGAVRGLAALTAVCRFTAPRSAWPMSGSAAAC